jgi:hypothetical protein
MGDVIWGGRKSYKAGVVNKGCEESGAEGKEPI